MGDGSLEGIFSKVAHDHHLLRQSGTVRPAHVAPSPRGRLPDACIGSGPLLKTPTGHPQGPAVEEAVDQAHAAPEIREGPARFMSQRLFDKSELQGQGHGLIIVKEVRAALGGRPETFGGAHLVPACCNEDLEGRGGDAGAQGRPAGVAEAS